MSVDAAMKALHLGKKKEALEKLLLAWRKTRAPEVAAAIATLGRDVDATREPLPRNREQRLAAWKKRSAPKSAADVGVLLSAFDGFLAAQAEPLIEQVKTWPADPRITDALFALLESPPTGMRGRKASTFWERVFVTIGAMQDPRSLERLKVLRAKVSADTQERSGLHWADSSAVLRAALVATKPKPPPAAKKLSAEEKRLLSGLTTAPREDLPALFARVFAAPHDDALRQVLADTLLESGDARGELINLQLLPRLDAAQRKRMKQLLDQHARRWLGPLEPAILKSGLSYRRGFPAVAKLSTNQKAVVEQVMGRPEWNTFETLDVESWPAESRKAFLSQPLLSLRRALVLENAVDLPDHSVNWEHVSFRHVGQNEMNALCAVTTLPKLKVLELGFTFDGPFPQLWTSPMGRSIATVVGGITLEDWAKHAPANVVHFENFKTTAERTSDGLVVHINCDWTTTSIASTYGSELEPVKQLLDRVTIATKEQVEPAEKKALERRIKGVPVEWVLKGA